MSHLLPPTRYFSLDGKQQATAVDLYNQVAHLPLVCPHGHVDPHLFVDENGRLGSPTQLFLIPDHYIFRMLYSQGISLESLAIPRKDGQPSQTDHRHAWQQFADHFYLFRGTPTALWLRESFAALFGITQTLNGRNAQTLYDQIDAHLQSADFAPRRLYDRFNIELLCTTDAATDTLAAHQAIRASGWHGRILPTFRPDAVVNIGPDWPKHINQLSLVSGIDIHNYATFIQALEQRRAFFQQMGAHATDHAALTAYTAVLSQEEADAIFQRARHGQARATDATRFTGHMLIEMARMSTEDGLVMQLHVGAYRNHNPHIFRHFGADMGADIPTSSEFTQNLRPLLNQFGNHPQLTLILFNLDETTYSRELAPLAGHYPAIKLGPPWWFFDSLNGMRRYFDQVMETAGLYNTAGFNDDTRAYPSIPARHDLWRRAAADWAASLVERHLITLDEGHDITRALAYDLAKTAYNFT